MNLPELPPFFSKLLDNVMLYTEQQMHEYGAACYAKGRTDLLAEIGEPVAWKWELKPFSPRVEFYKPAKENFDKGTLIHRTGAYK